MSAAINTATIATEETIELAFARWGEWRGGTIYTKAILAGFVTWTWDERPATLEMLRAESAQLIEDIKYMVECDEVMRTLDGIEEAAAEFLDSYRDELIEAIEESLADD